MTEQGALLIGLTAIVAGLVGVLAFSVAKIIAASRALGKERGPGAETAFMATAMEQAVQRLREQERAMKERAEASERLSDEIVASITSGLLVVTGDRVVRTLNPAGRRILGVADGPDGPEGPEGPNRLMHHLLRTAAPLAAVVEDRKHHRILVRRIASRRRDRALDLER